MHEAERQQLLEMILATFERREIVLSSGRKSNFYLDCRIPLMQPLGQKLAGSFKFERPNDDLPDELRVTLTNVALGFGELDSATQKRPVELTIATSRLARRKYPVVRRSACPLSRRRLAA